MNSSKKNKANYVIVIVGPTGVGKSEIGLHVAEELNGEIISTDSRQMYQYMEIGTDKPPLEYLERIKHHFISCLDPSEYFNAGKFGKNARIVMNDIIKRGKLPVIVGGSGLYLKAILEGFFDEKIKDVQVKEQLKKEIIERGNTELYTELQKIDPKFAMQISVNDAQRIVRGLEVYRVTGKPLTYHWKMPQITVNFDYLPFGLTTNRKKLYQKINDRVDLMIERGLVEEVKSLIERGYNKDLNALQTYGYQEVFEYIEQKHTFEEMAEKIKKRTRNYAKRQITWFKKVNGITWISVEEDKKKAINIIVNAFRNRQANK